MLMTLIVGAKSVAAASRSSRSIAWPSASGCENSERIAKPRGPRSTIVPSGASSRT
jgi:hypothetical protein